MDEFRALDEAIQIIQKAERQSASLQAVWGKLYRVDKYLQERLKEALYGF